MKKILTTLFLFFSLASMSQKNEIVSFMGVSSNIFYYDEATAFQIKYERSLGKSISLQTGIRSHSEIQHDITETSKYIRYAFNSKKIDLTFMITPINCNNFKFKAGLGFDAGFSNYYWHWMGVIQQENDINEDNEIIKRNIYYWRYSIWNKIDVGMHFTFQGNYYFKNNLFGTIQLLYNPVFDRIVTLPTHSGGQLVRETPLCLSAGIGYRF